MKNDHVREDVLTEIPVAPDSGKRKIIANAAHADSHLCWTCSSCDLECPVNIATNSLRPQKLVRLANLGFMDELLGLPEIWYCLTCRRCNDVCPNIVKPADIVSYARRELLERQIVSYDKYRRYRDLFARFQRVRWHATAHCFEENLDELSEAKWFEWLETPVENKVSKINIQQYPLVSEQLRDAAATTQVRSCYTCSECTSVCPISSERNVFDPQAIIRMANFGMLDELVRSPSIWLCITCQRCTNSCSQWVQGHQIILDLREMALSQGAVDAGFKFRLEKAEKLIYSRLLFEIDELFGFMKGRG
jgi:heterodisulfide reductase subunit C